MPGHDDIRSCMIAALSVTHGLDTTEIEEALADLGDDYLHELDSKTAEFLLVAAEVVVGKNLPCPADLGPEQYATLGALIDVVLKEL